jgi:hypothetical protein
MSQLMRGPTRLRAVMETYLADTVPPLLVIARDQWGLDEFSLPDPRRYDTTDPTMVANDEYPMLGATVLSAANFIRQDIGEEAEQEYGIRYPVRIFVIARTPQLANGEWEEDVKNSAVRVCQDLTQVVVNLLLQTPSMGMPEAVRMDETTLAVQYADSVMPNTQSKRYICMSAINCDITFMETTWAVKYGDADTIDLTVQKLTP